MRPIQLLGVRGFAVSLVPGLLLGILAGCGEPRYVARPLPVLATTVEARPIVVPQLLLVPGERLVWGIQQQGFTIARAELVVDEQRVHSRLRTSTLASMFAVVDHELTTTLDPARTRPAQAAESLAIDGKHERVDTIFDGARYQIGGKSWPIPGGRAHTVHSALGALRAWANAEAAAGYVFVVHAGALHRLDVDRPIVEDLQDTHALRIDGRVRASADSSPIRVTMWLTASADRIPLRIEIAQDGVQLTAERID